MLPKRLTHWRRLLLPKGLTRRSRAGGAPGRRVPLRLRLALLAAALLGMTLLAFSFFIYFTLARALTTEVDRALFDRAQVVIRSITVDESLPGLISVDPPDVDAIATGGAVAQVALFNGQVARSEALGRLVLPISLEARAAARSGRASFELVQLAGIDLRLYNEPLVWRDSTIGMVQVARDIGPTEAALARLRLVLVAGTLASAGVCGLLGLLVARAALRPIDRLTREAEQIGQSQDFGRRVSGTGTTSRDEVGRLAATFNGMLDRLQSAYAAVQNGNVRLEATLESQRRFVADASHELRTPLTTVRGNASLLRRFETLTPADRVEVVAQIAAESERMSRLVSDLLTLARADAGQRVERKSVALAPLVEAVAQQGRLLADGVVSLSVARLAGGDDMVIMGDADALRQLLLILVDNAIKYTPAGGSVTLGLGVETQPSGARLARISVVDTGVGMAPSDLPHIFERFYRADRARRTGGTGLGLAIGKWIAEAHGGTITTESAPGAGSIFTVTLPAVAIPPSPSKEPAVEPVERPDAEGRDQPAFQPAASDEAQLVLTKPVPDLTPFRKGEGERADY